MAAIGHATRRFQGKPESGVEARTMVQADLDDGQRLVALNEIFVGHRTHQSAKYRIRLGNLSERHSSSGLIITTGTGATGWARSVHRGRVTPVTLPAHRAAPRLLRPRGVAQRRHRHRSHRRHPGPGRSAGDHVRIQRRRGHLRRWHRDGSPGLSSGMTARIGISPRTLRLG
ncbi:MAG: hypothetical protein R3F43_18655 [bacterium]